jgi:hypothetical protein
VLIGGTTITGVEVTSTVAVTDGDGAIPVASALDELLAATTVRGGNVGVGSAGLSRVHAMTPPSKKTLSAKIQKRFTKLTSVMANPPILGWCRRVA